MTQLHETWAWLQSSPLLGITLTLGSYAASRWIFERTGRHAAAQPVLLCLVMVGSFLSLSGVSYRDYLSGAQAIGFWLGPATVALALPLHREWDRVRRVVVPIVVGVVVGAAVSIASAVLLVRLGGGGETLVATMAPKAATTPVSIAVAAEQGGLPPVTAVLTILAGISGAVLGPRLLTWARVGDPRARGVAIGVSSHGIGTARALTQSRTEGAFSGLSMALTALTTSLMVPMVLVWWG